MGCENNGGKRAGAGRKGANFRNPKAMAEATSLIDKAQPKAVKALIEALQATREFPRIVGRDEKGHPEYEYVSVPDHIARTNAAKALLAKRIPDLAHTTHANDKENPVVVYIDSADAKL